MYFDTVLTIKPKLSFRLTSPLLLIAVGVSLGAGYKLSKRQNEKKLVIFGHEVTLAQQYGILAICSIFLFMWAGAGAAVFWVLGRLYLLKELKDYMHIEIAY